MGFFDGIGKAIGGIASGALSAVSGNPLGVFDAVTGFLGQKSSNDAQLAATRATNEMNYKIWQEEKEHNVDMFKMQNQANIDMWNMQNAYNTPLAQKERLIEAGLNPNLAMGSNATGNATSAPASSSINSSQSPTMQAPPFTAYTSPIGVAIDRMLQSNLQMAQISGQKLANASQETNNEYLPKILGKQLESLEKDLENKALVNENQRGENMVERWTRSDRVASAKSIAKQQAADSKVSEETAQERVDLLKAEKLEKQLSNTEKFILLKYLEPNQVVMYLQQVQNLANLQKNYDLTDKQIREIAARIGLIREQTKTQKKLTEKASMDAWNSMEDGISKQRENSLYDSSLQSGDLLKVFDSVFKLAKLQVEYELGGYEDLQDLIDVSKIDGKSLPGGYIRIKRGMDILDQHDPGKGSDLLKSSDLLKLLPRILFKK